MTHNPILSEMESHVEGLLVNRLGYSRGYSAAEYYLLPIDECYKLVESVINKTLCNEVLNGNGLGSWRTSKQ